MAQDAKCETCGREMNGHHSVPACIECCDHPEIKGRENSLMVARCDVCGVKINEDDETHPDEFESVAEGGA